MLSLLVAGEVVDNPVKPETTRAADQVRQLRRQGALDRTSAAPSRSKRRAPCLPADLQPPLDLDTVRARGCPAHLPPGAGSFAPLRGSELGFFSTTDHFRRPLPFGSSARPRRRREGSSLPACSRELSTIVTAGLPAGAIACPHGRGLQLVRDYERFRRGDVASLLALFDPGIEWRLAEGHPYSPKGEVWIGPKAVAENLASSGRVASGMAGPSRPASSMRRPTR